MIRVLLADDHEVVRAGLRLLVDAQDDMTVIAEASTGDEALQKVPTLCPDVVVLDLSMPGLKGLDVVRALRGDTETTKIVVLTRHDDGAYVRQLLSAGVAAYVLKQSASSELLAAVRAAARNERYLDTALQPNDPSRTGPHEIPTLTAREEQVLRLAAIGYSNKEIASELNISVRTVEVHKTHGMRKLHLAGHADLVRHALCHGWMKDP